MMRATVCMLLALVVYSTTAYNTIPVLERTETHIDDDGRFSLKYLSGDGTIFSELGLLKPTADGKAYVLVKEGEYSFTAPNGHIYRTLYVADRDGYRVIGDDHSLFAPIKRSE